MKTKIIGITLAVIMLASVFGAMMPSSARTAAGIESGDTIFAGESGLSIDTTSLGTAVRFEGKLDGNAEGEVIPIDPADFYIPTDAVEGVYEVFDSGGKTGEVTIKEPAISANVYLAGSTDSIEGKSVPVGTEIKIRASPNFGGFIKTAGTTDNGDIKIKLIDPDGVTFRTYTEDASATRVEIDDILIEDDWETGTWTVKAESDKNTCNEVDVKSDAVEFTIRSEELSVEADEDEVGKGEDMYILVNGNPSTYYYLLVTDVDLDHPPVILDVGDVKDVADAGDGDLEGLAAWIKTGSDGLAEVKISTTAADERTYTIAAYYKFTAEDPWPTTTTPADYYTEEDIEEPEDDDDTKVEVKEATVTFDIPTKAIIGEDVDIMGSVSAGDKVFVLVKDQEVLTGTSGKAVDENNEFSVEWDTDGMITGSYTIEVYIDLDDALDIATPDARFEDLDTYDGEDPDGKATIRLIEPGLDATQPRSVVAEGDDYTIEGTATGVGDVDYILVGPKGWKKTGYGDIRDGLVLARASVDDDEFSEDEPMSEGLDTGVWVAIVLSPGRDGFYEAPEDETSSLSEADLEFIGAAPGKSQTQILEIIDDAITQAGSDDLMATLSFKVESGYVELDPIEDVGVGDPINVTGKTNREPDTAITISTFAGPTDLVGLTEVEWTDEEYGTFSATIDTTDAEEGTYTFEADDGDGNTDTETMTIGAAAPTAAPTATPAATATPTAAPTPVATATPAATAAPTAAPTPTPEEPGFEAVFAIAGLLAVAYLVLRIKK